MCLSGLCCGRPGLGENWPAQASGPALDPRGAGAGLCLHSLATLIHYQHCWADWAQVTFYPKAVMAQPAVTLVCGTGLCRMHWNQQTFSQQCGGWEPAPAAEMRWNSRWLSLLGLLWQSAPDWRASRMQVYVLTVLGAGSPRSGGSSWLLWASVLGLQTAVFSPHPHRASPLCECANLISLLIKTPVA